MKAGTGPASSANGLAEAAFSNGAGLPVHNRQAERPTTRNARLGDLGRTSRQAP